MGLFRFIRQRTEEYKFLWNAMVGLHTLRMLSPERRSEVWQHHVVMMEFSDVDRRQEAGFCAAAEFYWIARALEDMGILPFLGTRRVEWRLVANPRQACFASQGAYGPQLFQEVLQDIQREQGILIEPPSPEEFADLLRRF